MPNPGQEDFRVRGVALTGGAGSLVSDATLQAWLELTELEILGEYTHSHGSEGICEGETDTETFSSLSLHTSSEQGSKWRR